MRRSQSYNIPKFWLLKFDFKFDFNQVIERLSFPNENKKIGEKWLKQVS